MREKFKPDRKIPKSTELGGYRMRNLKKMPEEDI